MFMTAAQIKERFEPGDMRSGGTKKQLWKQKYKEAKDETWGMHGAGVALGIEEARGVITPVDVNNQLLLNGHHRVAVMAKDHPDWLIPIQHHTQFTPSVQARIPEPFLGNRSKQEQAKWRDHLPFTSLHMAGTSSEWSS